MLDMSAAALSVVLRSYEMQVRGTVWQNGVLLATDVPISDGTETRDRSLAVPESISLTVPRRVSGVEWSPTAASDPLATYGQQMLISIGVDTGAAGVEWIERGWFLITDTAPDGDTLTVTLAGLLQLIDEAHFAGPYQPSGTFVSTIQGLVEPGLTVSFDASLVDRPIPVGMQWDDDRMAALTEVLSAWPAVCEVTEGGFLLVGPLDDSGAPVLDLIDTGPKGTVIRWAGESTRDGAFNCVVAQGEDVFGNAIQGAAYDTDPNSPYQFGGPFSPFPVPQITNSSLLTTVDQCRAAAAATLALNRRTASLKLTVTCVPHPGVETGDVVTLTSAQLGLSKALGIIEALTMPYTPNEMTLTVRLL
jgi:hypothetical protein